MLKYLRNAYLKEQTSLIGLAFYKAALFLKGCAYTFKFRKHLQATRNELNNLRQSKAKNVFVFANGPSISDLDLMKVKTLVDENQFDLITINSFASKAISQFDLRPTFSLFADHYHFTGGESGVLTEQANADIEAINKKSIPAFVPCQFIEQSQFNKSIPFCTVTNLYSNNVSDVCRPLGYYPLTALYAISVALNLKYENIYVCGFDNSYFKDFEVDQENKKYFYDKHFYDSSKHNKREVAAVYEKTSDVFLNFYRYFAFMEKISRHGVRGSRIFNIAKTTYTDAFDRELKLDIYTNTKIII